MKAPESETKRARTEFFEGDRKRDEFLFRQFEGLKTDDEKRAKIQALMNEGKYNMALGAYRIFPALKSSNDCRLKRECHQKVGENYGELFQLVSESYLAALQCCAEIPAEEMTDADRKAIAQIFSGLIRAVNELASKWLIHNDKVEEFLVFYLKNFALLNQNQPRFLGLDDITLDKMAEQAHDRTQDPIHMTARTHVAVIKLFGKEAGRPSKASEDEIEKLKKLAVGPFSLLHLALGVNATPLFSEKVAARMREEEARLARSPQKSAQSHRK